MSAEPGQARASTGAAAALARDSDLMRTHQPDQDVFRSVRPEDIDWQPFPAFPPSARLAVVVGHPTEPGPYLIRVKVPGGVRLMPHRHSEDRVYTVISGVFYIAWANDSTTRSWRRIRPVRSSCCPAVPRTSTGPNPVNTSPR